MYSKYELYIFKVDRTVQQICFIQQVQHTSVGYCVFCRFTLQYRYCGDVHKNSIVYFVAEQLCKRDVQQILIAYFAGSPYSTDVEEMYSSDYDAPEELKEAIIVRTPT